MGFDDVTGAIKLFLALVGMLIGIFLLVVLLHTLVQFGWQYLLPAITQYFTNLGIR